MQVLEVLPAHGQAKAPDGQRAHRVKHLRNCCRKSGCCPPWRILNPTRFPVASTSSIRLSICLSVLFLFCFMFYFPRVGSLLPTMRVVAFISLVTLTPAKLKKAMEQIKQQIVRAVVASRKNGKGGKSPASMLSAFKNNFSWAQLYYF